LAKIGHQRIVPICWHNFIGQIPLALLSAMQPIEVHLMVFAVVRHFVYGKSISLEYYKDLYIVSGNLFSFFYCFISIVLTIEYDEFNLHQKLYAFYVS
jgi:hypothetical protein